MSVVMEGSGSAPTKKWVRKSSLTGIYRITSPSGRIYIGQSWDIKNRWRLHKFSGNKKNGCPLLEKSFNKYGSSEHVFEIIHQLPSDITQDVLNSYEELYISQYRGCGIRMMNLCSGGGNRRSAQSTKEKIRKAMIGNNWGFKKGAVPLNKGKKGGIPWNKGTKGLYSLTEDAKKKISDANKGKQFSLGRKLSEEHKQKIIQSNIGRKMPEHVKEILDKYRSPENAKKMGYLNKGKVRTDENKENIRQTLLAMESNKGELHSCAKLSNEQVIEIRAKYIKGVYGTYRLAKEYGISNTHAKDIVHRKTWKHLW